MIRSLSPMPLLGLLAMAGCSTTSALDWDLRSGAPYDTSAAAQGAAAAPPRADARGVVSYPGYQIAVARRGDTVGSVAARLGLGADSLARHNALQVNDPLREGEILALPGGTAPFPATGGTGAARTDVAAIATTALDRVGGEAAAPGTKSPGGAQGGAPLQHRVVRGETAFSVARTYGVSARALADWNGLGPDLGVREGQVLLIPTAKAATPAPAPQNPAPGQGSPTPEPPSARLPLPAEKTAAAPPATGTTAPDLGGARSSASAAQMAMPVAGKIIRGYVKKKNDGIDIAAPAGTVVRAAADGTVAAITKDTSGTPIVVIRHDGGLLTVYAGVDAVSRAKGASVKRGEAIAKVKAGDPSFLHFEVRKGVDSVDPLPYLQ